MTIATQDRTISQAFGPPATRVPHGHTTGPSFSKAHVRQGSRSCDRALQSVHTLRSVGFQQQEILSLSELDTVVFNTTVVSSMCQDPTSMVSFRPLDSVLAFFRLWNRDWDSPYRLAGKCDFTPDPVPRMDPVSGRWWSVGFITSGPGMLNKMQTGINS